MGPGEKRMGVFELYSMRQERTLERMRRHQEDWEQALRQYRNGQWREAAERFAAYLSRLPHDRPARHFLRQCRARAERR
jgi:TolA-binding protein